MLGAINHIAITVVDLEKSDKFYKPILNFLGYKRTLECKELSGWESESTGIGINFWRAKDELKNTSTLSTHQVCIILLSTLRQKIG